MQPETKIERQRVENILPLTFMQEGVLAAYLSDPDRRMYFNQITLTMQGHVDSSRLQRAFLAVIASNPMLRCIYSWKISNQPVQIILKSIDFLLNHIDLSHKSPVEAQDYVTQFIQQDMKKGINISQKVFQATLITLAEESLLVIGYHHIMMDGWSNGILFRELMLAYKSDAVINNKKSFSFEYYIKWLKTADFTEAERFWKEYIADYGDITGIPACETQIRDSGCEQYTLAMNPDLMKKIKNYVVLHETTIATIFYVAWGILLQKINCTDDIIFGTPISERGKLENMEDLIAPMIHTVPIRMKYHGDQRISELLAAVKNEIQAIMQYSHYPYRDIIKNSNVSDGNLFNSLLTIENYPLLIANTNSGFDIKSFIYRECNPIDFSLMIATFSTPFEITVNFDSSLYNKVYVEKIITCYSQLLQQIVMADDLKINALTILPTYEHSLICGRFNNTEKYFERKPSSLLETLVNKAQSAPNACACITDSGSVTYGALWGKIKELANLLIDAGVQRNSIVAVRMHRSLEMLVGIYAILAAGGAYLPISVESPEERINYLLMDSGAKILLTNEPVNFDTKARIIDVTDIQYEGGKDELTLINHAEDLAYVIYTSGSTGNPKGVMINHAAIMNRLLWMDEAFTLTGHDRIMFKTPYNFDVSVWEIFWFTFSDAKLYILPNGMEKDALLIAKAIVANRISVLHFVPSMLEAFLDTVHEQDSGNDFDMLRYIIASGEVLTSSHVSKFDTVFHRLPVRLYNLYGPTEAAVDVSYFDATGKDKIYIGQPISNMQLYILNHHHQLQPIGIWGELCIAGVGLARGYMNNPTLTDERFINWTDNQRIYMTGDIARWTSDGQIEFLGRKDQQVKIHGIRIELNETQAHLLTYPAIKKAVVTAQKHTNGRDYLCAFVMTDEEDFDKDKIRLHLKKYLPEYMIPERFVITDEILLLPNGKINYRALNKLLCQAISSRGQVAITKDLLTFEEKTILEIWRKVLQEERIDVDSDFSMVGGDSILATQIANRINRELHTNLIPTDILRTRTVSSLAALVLKELNKQTSTYPPHIAKHPEKPVYPASPIQRRFYILNRLQNNSMNYHIKGAIRIKGNLDVDRLEQAFATIVARHEVLRTSFQEENQQILQIVHPALDFAFDRLDSSDAEDGLIKNYDHTFSLNELPLFRLGIYIKCATEYDLLFDIHHVVVDGLSLQIIWEEVFAVYSGNTLEHPTLQYRDYSVWQFEKQRNDTLESHKSYWLSKLSGDLTLLDFPTDYPREPKQTRNVGVVNIHLPTQKSDLISTFASKSKCTIYTVLLAAYFLALYRYTGQEDILIGTPMDGRIHPDVETMVGVFVNTVALRAKVDAEASLNMFLSCVHRLVTEALEHQDYPFDLLVNKLVSQRSLDRNPIFDAMLTMMDYRYLQVQKEGLDFSLLQQESNHNTVELDLEVAVSDSIYLRLMFDGDLYREDKMKQFLNHYVNILEQFVVNSEQLIKDMEILNIEEQFQLLSFCGGELYYPKDKTLADIIASRAREIPNKKAVVCGNDELTYGKLQSVSDILAGYLHRRGISSGVPVPLVMSRSIWTIIAILGVWKAGGYIITIDASTPLKRIAYIVDDIQASFVLSDEVAHMQIGVNGLSVPLININACIEEAVSAGIPPIYPLSNPENAAYLIYTSGSTGKTKGVLVSHESLTSMAFNWRSAYRLDSLEIVVLQLARFSFDVFIGDLARTFLNDGTMILARESQRLELPQIASLIQEHKVTLFESTPSYVINLLQCAKRNAVDISSLKIIIMGSDICKVDDYRKVLLEYGAECRVVNSYGLTEATIDSCFYEETSPSEPLITLPIGQPLGNVRMYLVNAHDKLQPIGVKGEILIAGISVANGYVNAPEATARSFTANPFRPEERAYRTGDIGCWLPDGNLQFWGRRDNQLKIRGYRVDTEEVQKELCRHSAVSDAIVCGHTSKNGGQKLAAYIIAKEQLVQDDIVFYLAQRLPEYMIPEQFLFLDTFPLSENGKVDLRYLRELDADDSWLQHENKAAVHSFMEAEVLEIWSLVLKKNVANSEVGFFEIGGNSLLILELFNKLQAKYTIRFSVADLFTYNTVSAFCKLVHQKQKEIEIKASEGSLQENLVSMLTKVENHEVDLEEFKRNFGL